MVEPVSAHGKLGFLSIVVPVYGCESCLECLCRRIDQTLTAIEREYELILVDDRSPDQSWSKIKRLQEIYEKIKGVRLSRNYGQQIAITAGLSLAQGDMIIVMDCDLQDPPEIIPKLLDKINGGCDIVLARRTERGHSLFRKFGAKLYFRLLSFLTEEKIDGSYGTYSVITRKVVDNFLKFGERERHYLFIIRWLGFNIESVDYENEERHSGRSSYSWRTLVKHAFDGLFFQATVLLRWIVSIGLICSLFGLLLSIYYVVQYYMSGSLPGWTSLVVLILLSTGIILTCVGVIGLYVSKIFDQVKQRPLYVIDDIAVRSST